MALAKGTTSRQLQAAARWLLAGVIVFGSLTWWFSGYRVWAAMMIALLAALVLWVMARIANGDSTVPGSPVQLALAPAAAIMVWHWVDVTVLEPGGGIEGAVNTSLLVHVAIVALGMMLVQALLPRSVMHGAVLTVCGLAMMGGSTMHLLVGAANAAAGALAMTAWAGLGVFLVPLWRPPEAPTQLLAADDRWRLLDEGPMRRLLSRVRLVGSAVAAVVLTWLSPASAAMAAVAAALAMLAGALVWRPGRKALLAGGLVTACGGVTAWWLLVRPGAELVKLFSFGLLGMGERAAVDVAGSGLVFMSGMIGWLGLATCAALLVVAVGAMFVRSRHGRADHHGRAVVWLATAAMAVGAPLAAGGLFVPGVTLSAMLVLGLLSPMLSRPTRRRSGWVVVAVALTLMVLLGLGKNNGLMMWSVASMGGGDKLLHAMVGFVLALLLAWQMGCRRWWLGLAGVALAAAAGGVGELAQALLTSRNAEWMDWIGHAIGASLAAVPYLLAHLSRLAETGDGR